MSVSLSPSSTNQSPGKCPCRNLKFSSFMTSPYHCPPPPQTSHQGSVFVGTWSFPPLWQVCITVPLLHKPVTREVSLSEPGVFLLYDKSVSLSPSSTNQSPGKCLCRNLKFSSFMTSLYHCPPPPQTSHQGSVFVGTWSFPPLWQVRITVPLLHKPVTREVSLSEPEVFLLYDKSVSLSPSSTNQSPGKCICRNLKFSSFMTSPYHCPPPPQTSHQGSVFVGTWSFPPLWQVRITVPLLHKPVTREVSLSEPGVFLLFDKSVSLSPSSTNQSPGKCLCRNLKFSSFMTSPYHCPPPPQTSHQGSVFVGTWSFPPLWHVPCHCPLLDRPVTSEVSLQEPPVCHAGHHVEYGGLEESWYVHRGSPTAHQDDKWGG